VKSLGIQSWKFSPGPEAGVVAFLLSSRFFWEFLHSMSGAELFSWSPNFCDCWTVSVSSEGLCFSEGTLALVKRLPS